MSELQFRVLTNAEGRYSLWSTMRPVPRGWKVALENRPHSECLGFVRESWKTLQVVKVSPGPKIGFGLMFFGSDGGENARLIYENVIQAARFADENGFSAIWLPERHFAPMGSLFPNPAVLHAALARETKSVLLRSGSVVLPLHHPARVAEEWAVVDNLSGGRVELALAAGWNAEDFLLAPEKYADRYDALKRGYLALRTLWRGEVIDGIDGNGKQAQIRTYPPPYQLEIPCWFTAAGSERTFEMAGQMGVNLLTHLFDHDVENLARKINKYKLARESQGYVGSGRVAVALHTFLGQSAEEVRARAREPYARYLEANLGMLQNLAHSRGLPINLSTLPPSQLRQATEWMFDKFTNRRSLIGTVDDCTKVVDDLISIGVDEIACLIDFGPSWNDIFASLRLLKQLKDSYK